MIGEVLQVKSDGFYGKVAKGLVIPQGDDLLRLATNLLCTVIDPSLVGGHLRANVRLPVPVRHRRVPGKSNRCEGSSEKSHSVVDCV